LDERVRTTSTAQAQGTRHAESTAAAQAATMTAQSIATMTAQAILSATANSLATQQAQIDFVATVESLRVVVYGPNSGSLEHEADDGFIKIESAGVDLQNFVVESWFVNPYSVDEGEWDYGFLFRYAGDNDQYRFAIRSDKVWILLNNTGDADGTMIASGDLPDLKVGESDSNHVRLICQGDHGYFYLNGMFISDLDLSARQNSGDIYIATGIYSGREISGRSTGYQDFTIWSLP
jgi:hypothetical protein